MKITCWPREDGGQVQAWGPQGKWPNIAQGQKIATKAKLHLSARCVPGSELGSAKTERHRLPHPLSLGGAWGVEETIAGTPVGLKLVR